MKTTTKVILAISLGMIVLGTGLSVIAWAVSGGNIGVIWNPQDGFYRGPQGSSTASISRNLEKDSVSPGAFQSISLNTDYGNVRLIPAEDYRVDYSLLADLPPVEIRVENGVLIVENTPDVFSGINVIGSSPWNLLGNLGDKLYINVYYPRSATLTDVTLTSDMGELEVTGLHASGLLDIRSDMGAIELKSVTAGNVTLQADMGAVELDGLTADILTASLSMGAFEAENCSVGQTELDLDMGGADIKGDFFGDIDINCDMGGVEFKTSRPRSDYFIDISTDLGGSTVDGQSYRAGSAGSPDAPYRITITCGMGGADLSFGR